MLQNVRHKQQRCGAMATERSRNMETRDHSNGVSPKNHRSRGNLLMKVCFSLLVANIIICGLLFTGCGVGGNSPSSVVEKALNASIKRDADAALKCYYNVSDDEKESLRRLLAKEESDYDVVKFEIQDERIFDNGEKAEVIVKVLLRNGRTDTNGLQLVKTSSGWKIRR